MIADSLNYIERYACLGQRMKQAVDFVTAHADGGLEDGRYEIEGDNVYATVSTVSAKPPEEGLFEAHREYADLQYILSGEELLGIAPLEECKEVIPYDAQRDIAFYTAEGFTIPRRAGDFYIVFPNDAHMPCVHRTPTQIRKLVVKIKL